jgi:hypothetical protein
MKYGLTALLSAAALCAFAWAAPAAAQVGAYPTVSSNTGAPLYAYHRTGAVPAPSGKCEIIAGNRVCTGAPAGTYAYGYGFPGPFPFGAAVAAPVNAAGALVAAPLAATGGLVVAPVNAAGAIVAAPLSATGALVTAPVAATGAIVGAPFVAASQTVAPLTGTPAYSYSAPPAPAIGGGCDIIAGNRVCTTGYVP